MIRTKILAMIVAISMIVAVVPGLAITASADESTGFAAEAKWFAVDFDLVDIGSGYSDVGITGADGETVFASFTNAWRSEDGFYVPDGDRSYSTKDTRTSATTASLYFNAFADGARIRILAVQGDGSYEVSYFVNGNTNPFAKATYTGTLVGVSLPSLWKNVGGAAPQYDNVSIFAGDDAESIGCNEENLVYGSIGNRVYESAVASKTVTYNINNQTVEHKNGKDNSDESRDMHVYHSNWNQRVGLMQFTLPQASDEYDVVSAKLLMFCNFKNTDSNRNGRGRVTVGHVSTNDWTDTEYTNTDTLKIPGYKVSNEVTGDLPAEFTVVDEVVVGDKVNAWYEFDATDYVKGKMSTDGTVDISLAATHIVLDGETTTDEAINVAIAGSTKGDLAPQLVIETAPKSTEETVKAALDAISVASFAKANVELAKEITDEKGNKFAVTWKADVEDIVDVATGAVTASDSVAKVQLTPSATLNETPVEGNARTVTIIPKALAETTFTTTDGVYAIGSENLIGENADFSQGLAVWQDGTGAVINDAGFAAVKDGDVDYINVINYSSSGSGNSSAQALHRVIEGLTPGNQYLLAVTAKNLKSGYALISTTGATGTDTTGEVQLFKDTTDWERQAAIFTAESDKLNIAFRWCEDTSFESFELYEAIQSDTTLSSVEDIELTETTIISGNAPALPKTTMGTFSMGSQRPVEIKWNTDALDLTTPTDDGEPVKVTGTVDGLADKTFEVNVTVLPKSHSWDKLPSYGSQDSARSNALKFENATGKFSVEFDMTINKIADTSVQIGKDAAIFGAGQIALGIKDKNLKAVNAPNNQGEIILDTVAEGDSFRVLVSGDVETDKYSVTVVKPDGTVQTKGNISFRTTADAINSIVAVTNTSTNAADNNIVLTNIKVYDPNFISADLAEPALGWSDGQFTINFAFAGKDVTGTIKVTPEGDGTVTISDADVSGVAFAPADTNRRYSAKGSIGEREGEATKAISIYELVVDAIKNVASGDKFDEAQASKAAEVISNGGLYITKSGEGVWELPTKTAEIFTLNADEGTITLKKEIVESGINITSISYTTNDGATTETATAENGVITIEELKASAMLDADTIFLEEVEFTFEPDVVENAADESVSGELDFVEEV